MKFNCKIVKYRSAKKVLFSVRLDLAQPSAVTSGCKNQDGNGQEADLEASRWQSTNQWVTTSTFYI